MLLLVLGIYSIGLNSCDEELKSTPVVINMEKKAIIKGKLTADLNLQTVGSEIVPSGTTILLSIEYSEIFSGATGEWIKVDTVDNNGEYNTEVPATESGVKVSIKPVSFTADQILQHGASVATRKATCSETSTDMSVKHGITYIKDFDYDINASDDYKSCTIKGSITGEFDDTNAGPEDIPVGVSIVFYSSDNKWSTSYTTIAGGKYNLTKVPAQKTIKAKWGFVANKVISGTTVEYWFSGDKSLGVFNDNTVNYNNNINITSEGNSYVLSQ